MPANTATSNPAPRRPAAGVWLGALLLTALFAGCVPQPKTPEQTKADFIAKHSQGAIDGSAQTAKETESNQLPLRYQRPSYFAPSEASAAGATASAAAIPVGVRITPNEPKPLRLVIQQLAALKSMNISWANDVDKDSLVHVTIMPEEDFFEAIDNVLRQLDYFYELDGNTLVIKHKETKKFHIAMPFTASSYSTSVGGDVLGGSGGSSGGSSGGMTGTLSLQSSANKFDIWNNIQTNLDKILQIWSTPPTPVVAGANNAAPGAPGTGQPTTPANPAAAPQPAQPGAAGAVALANSQDSGHSGLGYYTIDRPIGLITVTAPRSVQTKIERYLTNLKNEIYRQVSIEAKIIEVTLSGDTTTGLDWSALSYKRDTATHVGLTLNHLDSININQGGTLNTDRNQTLLTFSTPNFNVLIDAIKQQGHVEILSNPKISVMNGEPAMISVGKNVTYVSKVTSTSDSQTGTVSYTVTPGNVMSGLGMGVIATIMDNGEIVLTLTPVTSVLTEPIEYKTFGSSASGNSVQIGLPEVNLREMNTMVRVKNGEMLVVGGLIDNSTDYNNQYVSGPGKLPILGKLFRTDGTVSQKKELIILLRPKIIPM